MLFISHRPGRVASPVPATRIRIGIDQTEQPDRVGSGLNLSPARVRIVNSTLKFCIQVAWDVKDFQVSGGPGWTDNDRYDIEAVAAGPFRGQEYRSMLQTLISERFGLVFHRESREKPGYSLVTVRSGPKLAPSTKEDPDILFSRTPSGDRTMRAPHISMGQLAQALSSAVGATVADQTAIDGHFDVSLQWTPDPGSEPVRTKSGEPLPPPAADAIPGPSIFAALQEKLGLKLEAAKVPVEVLVIDRAVRPSAN